MAEKRCGCKGVRSCLLCEDSSDNIVREHSQEEVEQKWFQCQFCGMIFQKSCAAENFSCFIGSETCKGPVENSPDFSGVAVISNFIDATEERNLIQQIDSQGWAESQSGRMKQASVATSL